MKLLNFTLFYVSFLILSIGNVLSKSIPIVVNTWDFTNATIKAWDVVNRQGRSAIDAVVEGCTVCEVEQCDLNVGYGGSPDEAGETTLDSMIMDGKTMKVGAVAGLRNIKEAISVARHVFDYTKHTLLVGDLATEFAVKMGFEMQTLSTPQSDEMINNWKSKNCQPNFWQNVVPSPETSCGPYKKIDSMQSERKMQVQMSATAERDHDTIGMIAIDRNGNIAAGTSTNGLTYKIPGRVGDSPIPGSGAYADNSVGGATATGDGDIMMRFAASFLAVEFLRNGFTPQQAAEMVIDRINKYYPESTAAILVVDMEGNYAAACQTFNPFPISIYHPDLNQVQVETIRCRQIGDETPSRGSIFSVRGILLVMVTVVIII